MTAAQNTQQSLNDQQLGAEILAQVDARLDGSNQDFLSLTTIADALAVSPFAVLDYCEQHWQQSPRAYARAKLAQQGSAPNSCLAIRPLSAQSQETRLAALGAPVPKSQQGHKQQQLDYAFMPTALGVMLLCASARGLVFLAFGSDKATLLSELQDNFSQAKLRENPSRLQSCLQVCNRAINADEQDIDLPLDVQAPPFHRLVLAELLAIGAGETSSYGQIAHILGKPKGARAVGQACAKNQISLAIPCHRCLTQGGGFGGYRWGLERKHKLLSNEGIALKL